MEAVTSLPPRDAPAPLEWHPAYRDKTWLLDWLHGLGPFGDRWDIELPIARRLRWTDPDDSPIGPEMRRERLTKHRCAAGAPYVGEPFVYEWMAAYDTLGRCIAGESTIRHHSDYRQEWP